jgi:hypothetical protein
MAVTDNYARRRYPPLAPLTTPIVIPRDWARHICLVFDQACEADEEICCEPTREIMQHLLSLYPDLREDHFVKGILHE